MNFVGAVCWGFFALAAVLGIVHRADMSLLCGAFIVGAAAFCSAWPRLVVMLAGVLGVALLLGLFHRGGVL